MNNGRVGELITKLLQAGLAVGDNPVIIQDEDGAEYRLVEVNHDTGDIAIILAAPEM